MGIHEQSIVAVPPKSARRRRFSGPFKQELVEQTLGADVSVAGVALANGLIINLLSRWCRDYLMAQAAGQTAHADSGSCHGKPTGRVVGSCKIDRRCRRWRDRSPTWRHRRRRSRRAGPGRPRHGVARTAAVWPRITVDTSNASRPVQSNSSMTPLGSRARNRDGGMTNPSGAGGAGHLCFSIRLALLPLRTTGTNASAGVSIAPAEWMPTFRSLPASRQVRRNSRLLKSKLGSVWLRRTLAELF